MTSIMWFRRDLRLEDNTALSHALKDSEKLLLLFQVNPEQFLTESLNQQAFFASLTAFQQNVNRNAHLQILYGNPQESFQKIKDTLTDWDRVYFNQDERGFGNTRDREIEKFFKEQGIVVHSYMDHHLHGAKEIKNKQGSFYKVFTPYYQQWKEKIKPTPVETPFNPKIVIKETLFPKDEQQLEELIADLPDQNSDSIGEKAAIEQLNRFLTEDLSDYETARDYPNLDKTSRLSRHLRTGELSIRTVWQELQKQKNSIAKQTFEKELCWRDFYNMIYAANPEQKEQPIQEQFRFIRWQNDQDNFSAWKKGQTGFPIVDAAMRQLNQTGWMHNRLRMIVASFLTKDLLIDWRWGERYFQQMLIDYDPASNIGGWQWAASTGTDAVPYFRIFNPTTQAKKFDPSGAFIRSYLPELRELPEKLIHEPYKMSEEDQRNYGIQLGTDYPFQIVDHKEMRKKAIYAYEASKEFARETSEL
ncbi:cryptochrome/photolyase family protein [Enterococcus florum]|uniref:cryptochrome/photolyase family protein n=1 Tax=Enterococcus florum TaxID=2480627 RepID=UPI0011BAB975|nr:deoxyribodipyrimidine photo-lyase [Enterococcus florum]